jgi:phosphopantothenoylcysteine decarboxylase/phosphopantothenate--cysteine ligase
VQAVLTRNARRFVAPLTFEAITRERVITSQFTTGMNADIEHIALASDMDLLLVAPATANVIGKFANGIADDFLSALHLATKAPIVMAPAMNTHMWEHPAVVSNVATLAARGVRFIDPGSGYLACGWVGKGRLAEPAEIVEGAVQALASGGSLADWRILVTAGPTFEDLDPVRFIGNRSSGRMGFAIAAEATRRGAAVTLIAGPTSVEPPRVDTLVRVRSAAEMHAAVMVEADRADAVIMAAAVADFAPRAGAESSKLARAKGLSLDLERTPDILAELGAKRGSNPHPVLVGFAAQTGDPVAAATTKRTAKRVDLIVANDVTEPGAGFDVDTNRVTLVGADSIEPLDLMPKTAVARTILDRVESLLQVAASSESR